MTIGSNIKQIRKEKKLTQSDLAKKINKGLRTVQKYESDDINIPIDVLKDIAKTLDIELIDLIIDDNNSVYLEVLKLLGSDVLQKQLGYSFNELASNENNLIRMILNIMNSIKNDLRFIMKSKTTTTNIEKDKS